MVGRPKVENMELDEFSQRIKEIAISVGKNVNKTVHQVALLAVREVVLGTPVDTGKARSNWLVKLGSPDRRVIEPLAPGAASSQSALDHAQSVIAVRINEDIYISNNVDYIGKLNDGTSAQAPPGYVQSAVLRAARIVERAKVVP